MDEITAFRELKKKVLEERGLDLDQYKENYLKRRFAVRMRALHAQTYVEYLEMLSNKEEMNILLDKLTINVTQFFRDPEMYIEFENELLPEILRKKQGVLKIWSAGCSSGEEPYSVAMSVQEVSEKLGVKDMEFEIHATDFDERILRMALEGKYEKRTMENIAPARREKYFSRNGDYFFISEGIKKKVVFKRLNLMEPYKENYFDIIFCRNVIIYFTKDLQKRVMQYFFDALKRDGVLILGKTETMLIDYRSKLKCINIRERMFRKAEEE